MSHEDTASAEKTSFWKTLPGIATAIAGLLGGIAALLTALIATGVIGPPLAQRDTGEPAMSPREAVERLHSAWIADDRAAALDVASEGAVTELFETIAVADRGGERFLGCRARVTHHACSYRASGDRSFVIELLVTGNPAHGYVISSASIPRF